MKNEVKAKLATVYPLLRASDGSAPSHQSDESVAESVTVVQE